MNINYRLWSGFSSGLFNEVVSISLSINGFQEDAEVRSDCRIVIELPRVGALFLQHKSNNKWICLRFSFKKIIVILKINDSSLLHVESFDLYES